MFVFLSPLSADSNWIHFESGFAYALDVRVIPVGCNGLDLAAMNPPLSLLQGFNLHSEAGMNNILAILNEEFGFDHDESFAQTEFDSLTNAFVLGRSSRLSSHADLIEDVIGKIDATKALSLEELAATFTEKELGHYVGEKRLTGLGIVIEQFQSTPSSKKKEGVVSTINIRAGFESLSGNLPVIFELARRLRNEEQPEVALEIQFARTIYIHEDFHLVTDRLFGTTATLEDETWASFNGLTFRAGTHRHLTHRGTSLGSSYLKVKGTEDVLTIENIDRLISLLFERGILQERN